MQVQIVQSGFFWLVYKDLEGCAFVSLLGKAKQNMLGYIKLNGYRNLLCD